MANNKIPVTIYITPEYYRDKGHFWSRLNLVKKFHGGHSDQVILLISYKYYKPTITGRQIAHYTEMIHSFPHVAVIHAEGVDWRGHDKELIAMGIPIYPCEYTGSL